MRFFYHFRSTLLLTLLTFLIGFPTVSEAQTTPLYGNEWINYSQTYYKIKVVNTGMHRLSYNDLIAAGISNVNPQKFQLFRRGQEVAIYVNGQSDGVLNSGDYIDFYGEKNDGKLDTILYVPRNKQVHTYYSLFTDTAAYFLTWGNTNGKRMVEKISNPAGLTPEQSYTASVLSLKTSNYFRGFQTTATANSMYDMSEGFFSQYYSTSKKDSLRLVGNISIGNKKPVLEVALITAYYNNSVHRVFIKPPGTVARPLTNTKTGASGNIPIQNFNYKKEKFELDFSDIHPNGSIYLRATVDSSASPIQYGRVAYYKVTYQHDLNLLGKNNIIYTDSNRISPSYFLFNNPPANAASYDITDPFNTVRINGVIQGSQYGFVVDPSINARKILVVNEQNFVTPAAIGSQNFKLITNPSNIDYLIVTNKKLHQPVSGTNYTDPPADYAAYRASAAGGGYSPVVVDVDQLVDQFHYGEFSQYAITNFVNWMLSNGNPKYLLLLGKGLDLGLNDGILRRNPTSMIALGENLVPPFGSPASDALLTANFNNNSLTPRIATGRVSANNGADIINYLEKVKQHESLGLEEWRKNVLHLGGGITSPEQAQFKRYLDNYKNKIEGPLLGAKVQTVARANNGAPVVSLNVKDKINAGLSLITFFGHSSSSISDLDIGYVSEPLNGYNNTGKYPMILMNGCSSGNAFNFKPTPTSRFSFSEDWLLTPEKGSILFLATVNTSVAFALNNYSSNFYSVAFSDSAFYGKPVGEIQVETIKRALSASPNNWDNQVVAQQMVLQGDPAVRLFAPEKPDYTFKTNGLKLQSNPPGSVVTASMDKFDLVIDVVNLGKATEDSLVISVKRTLPNGNVKLYKGIKFPPVYNEATYLFPIDSKNLQGFGNNKFEVMLDDGNHIAELQETNNTAQIEQFLSVNGVVALLPAEYGIVSTNKVKLVGQPVDLLSPARDYYFEIDTVNTFNSSFRRSQIVNSAKATVSWSLNLFQNTSPQDSLVFYWRIRFNTFNAGEDTIWSASSFRYIGNSQPGWSQSHFAQFDKAQKVTIDNKNSTHRWEFSPIFKSLEMRTAGGAKPFLAPPTYGIIVDNIAGASVGGCYNSTTPLIWAAAYNDKTLKQYAGFPTNKCGKAPDNFYIFNVSIASGRNDLVNFIQNVPTGYYVALLSENNVPFTTFTQTEKNAFKLIGSKLIDSLKTGDPFGIIGQKGVSATNAKLLQEKTFDKANTLPANEQNISISQVITGHSSEGKITSTKIGPASQWTTLHHTVKAQGMDEYQLDLYGYDLKGNRSLVQSDIQSKTYSLASVSAQQYPYLQLEIAKADTADRTAPQLEQWLVVYQPVPEGIMRPDLVGIEKYDDVTKQAEKGKVKLRFAFSNISGIPFSDSLSVVRSVTGSKIALQDTIKVKPLAAGDSIFFDYEFSTAGMKGNNSVRVDVNPYILPEQYYFNNFLEIPFTMPHADLHPVLDVAFDGVHIMDGDLVSPSPKIAINLKDEDKFDYVQDPNNLEVFLSKPDDLTNYERIDMTDQSLVTLPDMNSATDKRDFNIIFHPKGLADGLYSLRVQGKDNSENEAGFEPYGITFRVVNESSITHFYPYPNPFSSNTRFVFTLTGNPENMPRNLKIQIMTLTGKVVREIQKDELGPIHVGNNMSLPWDGTDEYGDKLANGAYLYRVVMEKPPLEEMKHRKTSADKSFKKEYGKLYILR